MLLAQSLAQATGFTSQWQNIGKIQNRGIELSISSTNIQTKDFTWSTNFNISFIRNELKALAQATCMHVPALIATLQVMTILLK